MWNVDNKSKSLQARKSKSKVFLFFFLFVCNNSTKLQTNLYYWLKNDLNADYSNLTRMSVVNAEDWRGIRINVKSVGTCIFRFFPDLSPKLSMVQYLFVFGKTGSQLCVFILCDNVAYFFFF